MKKLIILMLIIIPILSTNVGDSGWDGICPVCKEQGLLSKVYPETCYSTLAYCGLGYYDEKGEYYAPKKCNSTSCSYHCSNGHTFTQSFPSY